MFWKTENENCLTSPQSTHPPSYILLSQLLHVSFYCQAQTSSGLTQATREDSKKVADKFEIPLTNPLCIENILRGA